MKTVNVRCCCQPQKILGTLQLSESQVEARRFWVIERKTVEIKGAIGTSLVPPDIVENTHNLCVIKDFTKYGPEIGEVKTEIAVYSDDRPLEFWRKIQGFVENVRG